MVVVYGMFLFVSVQHVLKYGSMSFGFSILKMCLSADGHHVYVVCLCKLGYLLRVELCPCVHDDFVWGASPHQPGLYKAFQESFRTTRWSYTGYLETGCTIYKMVNMKVFPLSIGPSEAVNVKSIIEVKFISQASR